MSQRKVIGAMCLCNTASLNVYVIDERDERILSGLNNNKPRWRKLYYSKKGAYFNWGGSRVYLHEIERVRT